MGVKIVSLGISEVYQNETNNFYSFLIVYYTYFVFVQNWTLFQNPHETIWLIITLILAHSANCQLVKFLCSEKDLLLLPGVNSLWCLCLLVLSQGHYWLSVWTHGTIHAVFGGTYKSQKWHAIMWNFNTVNILLSGRFKLSLVSKEHLWERERERENSNGSFLALQLTLSGNRPLYGHFGFTL